MKQLRFFTSLCVVFALLLTACQDETNELKPASPEATTELSQEELIQAFNDGVAALEEAPGGETNARWFRNIPTFRVLLRALIREDLLGPVIANRWTAFLPTDQAFRNIGINAHNLDEVEGLREILLYHVLPERIRAQQFVPGFEPTLNGAAVQVSVDDHERRDELRINGSSVIFGNVFLVGSIGHVIDEVLIPPTESLVDLVTGSDDLSLLAEALTRADLVGAFTDEVSWTVFAPTNDAFVALLEELGFDSLEDIPVDVLTEVLLYHVLGQRVYSSDLSDGLVTTTLNEQSFTFDLSDEQPLIVDANGREIELIVNALDIQATNGVVHLVNRVLLPPLDSGS